MVLVDGAEHGVNVLISYWDANVVTTEEVIEELAELAPVEPGIAVGVVLVEVFHHFLAQLFFILLKGVKLGLGGFELTFTKVCGVNHLGYLTSDKNIFPHKNFHNPLNQINSHSKHTHIYTNLLY